MTKRNLIYARAANGAIGFKGRLPWPTIKEDLARFKELTMGHVVIMGRKTWESLPESLRPLPGRVNLVLSRSVPVKVHYPADMHELGMAHLLGTGTDFDGDCWAIGGASIIDEALRNPKTDRVELTQIHQDFEGDVFAPLPEQVGNWVEVARVNKMTAKGIPLSFITYERPKG